MELELETGDALMLQSRQLKLLSEGELEESSTCSSSTCLTAGGSSTPLRGTWGEGPTGKLHARVYRRLSVAFADSGTAALQQHLLDFAEVLEIFLRRQLFAKSSRC